MARPEPAQMADGGPEVETRAPRVSVVIPVYNGAGTIGRALQSVFEQTFTDYEVVVVDDGSTDRTHAVVKQYGDRVRLVEQPNRGQSAARNNGVRHSSGEFLALLDADDEWLPRKLELTVAAMLADPDAALVYSDIIVVNEAGEEFRRSHIRPDTAHAPSMDEMLARIWPIMPSTVVMRRAAFDRTGGFCEQLRGPEDIHFWPLMREQGHFIYLPDRYVRFTYGQLFPKVLNRDGPASIVDLIRARYGARADGLVKDFIRHQVRMIANAGVIEMSRGNTVGARRCFTQVLRYDRLHIKSYLRIVRSFMPAGVRRVLGGRAARGARRARA
jgi:glycosyltransferase involved in cell wall biosynthesis